LSDAGEDAIAIGLCGKKVEASRVFGFTGLDESWTCRKFGWEPGGVDTSYTASAVGWHLTMASTCCME
jgi:hypothetical protein